MYHTQAWCGQHCHVSIARHLSSHDWYCLNCLAHCMCQWRHLQRWTEQNETIYYVWFIHASVNVAYYYYELNCPYREILLLIIDAKFKRHINHHWSSYCVIILKLLRYFRVNFREPPILAHSLGSSIHLCRTCDLLPSNFSSMIFSNLAWPSDYVLYWTEEYFFHIIMRDISVHL